MKTQLTLLSVGAVALGVISTSAQAGVVFDNISAVQASTPGAAVTSTSSTPNTYMGAAYTLLPDTATITGFDLFPVNLSGTGYTGLRVNLYVWGGVNMGAVSAATPAFSDLLGTYSYEVTGTFNSGFYFPYQGDPVGSGPGFTLPTPLAISGTTIGVTLNYQGTTDGVNYSPANSLTSLISYGVPATVGSLVFNGYYRNANSEANGNFTSTLRSLGQSNQGLALRVFGEPIPEPASAGILGLGLAALFAFRRRSNV